MILNKLENNHDDNREIIVAKRNYENFQPVQRAYAPLDPRYRPPPCIYTSCKYRSRDTPQKGKRACLKNQPPFVLPWSA